MRSAPGVLWEAPLVANSSAQLPRRLEEDDDDDGGIGNPPVCRAGPLHPCHIMTLSDRVRLCLDPARRNLRVWNGERRTWLGSCEQRWRLR